MIQFMAYAAAFDPNPAHTVTYDDNSITVDGKKIIIYAIKDAKDCPWGQLGVDVVLECTGFYVSKEKITGSY